MKLERKEDDTYFFFDNDDDYTINFLFNHGRKRILGELDGTLQRELLETRGSVKRARDVTRTSFFSESIKCRTYK